MYQTLTRPDRIPDEMDMLGLWYASRASRPEHYHGSCAVTGRPRRLALPHRLADSPAGLVGRWQGMGMRAGSAGRIARTRWFISPPIDFPRKSRKLMGSLPPTVASILKEKNCATHHPWRPV